MVWRAGTDLEYRGDARSRGLDPPDGRPGPCGLRRGDLRRPVLRRPQCAPGRPTPTAGGRHRRVPTPKGPPRGSPCSFRRPGWLRHRYVGGSCGCSAGRIGSLATGATLGARYRLRSASARSRRPRRPERNPGPAERGVRRDQYLEIETYPEARVYPLPIWDELSPRLTLVFLGRAHDSSAVHRQVIEDVGCRGSGCSRGCEMRRLRLATLSLPGISTLSVMR